MANHHYRVIHSTHSQSFLADTISYIKDQNLYEDELYFISQMFEEKWTPRETTIDYGDGTIGDFPLKKYYDGNKA